MVQTLFTKRMAFKSFLNIDKIAVYFQNMLHNGFASDSSTQNYDFTIKLIRGVETVYLCSLYWKIPICIVDWKIYCMVFFNFLVMCSYKNAIYCYKYDIDIWIQSIILASFYSFSQGAGGSFDHSNNINWPVL